MVLNVGDPGDQSSWLLEARVKVLLCFAYCFCNAMVNLKFGEIGFPDF